MEIFRTECCGVFELHGVQTTPTKDTVMSVCENWFENDERGAYILFTTVKGRNGAKLAKFIKDNKLGEVNKQRPTVNANTTNMLYLWVWRVDKTAIESWWKKNKPDAEAYDIW